MKLKGKRIIYEALFLIVVKYKFNKRMTNLSDKRILFVVSQLKVGGAAKMIKYVANLCTLHFKEVTMVTYYDDFTPDDLDDSVNRYNLDVSFGSGVPTWRITALKRLRRIIKNSGCDIVCSFLPDISAMSFLATRGIKTIVVSCERGDPFEFSRLWKTIMTWIYKKSDFCVFQLEKARDFFGQKIAKHSFVIPNPYVLAENATPFEGVRKKTIVSAGRFSLQKRFDILINAYAKVRDSHPEYKLVLYGEGDYLTEYGKLIKKLNLEGFVELPGYVRNVASCIREDGIFVLSSDYEGIPNALIEAMSVGLPCVATDCTPGGPAFLTNNGERGLLVPVHDVDAMAGAIISLIEDPCLAVSLAKKATDIVNLLDVNVINKMWIDTFTNIINDGK